MTASRAQWVKIIVGALGAGCLSMAGVLQMAKRPWEFEDVVVALLFGIGNGCIGSMLGNTQKPKDAQIAQDLVDVAAADLEQKASAARRRADQGLPERRQSPP